MPEHQHGPECGHNKVSHGHRSINVSENNSEECKPVKNSKHVHGPGCGHDQVMHGDHVDYLVDGRLEHPHGDHNDDHGKMD